MTARATATREVLWRGWVLLLRGGNGGEGRGLGLGTDYGDGDGDAGGVLAGLGVVAAGWERRGGEWWPWRW